MKTFALNHPIIKELVDRVVLESITFKNGCYAESKTTGDTGEGIRGATANLIVFEESSLIKDEIIYQNIMPTVAAKSKIGYKIIHIGTPRGRNHFYKDSLDPEFKVHKYDWTYCPLIDPKFIERKTQARL